MINRPHIFANMLDAAVARGTMSQEDALNHPERESLTSYIGAESLAEVDRNLEPYPLRPGDTILLASDGMFKTLTPEEIRACLHGPGTSWAETLVQQALGKQREYQDNVTVLSVTLDGEPSPIVAAPARTVKIDPIAAAPPPPPPPPPPLPGATPQPALSWPAPEEFQTGTHQAGRKRSPWVLVVVLVFVAGLVAAAGFAGWRWYTNYSHPVPVADPATNLPAVPTPSQPVRQPSPTDPTPAELTPSQAAPPQPEPTQPEPPQPRTPPQ
jgi:hypothetical protein